MGEPRNIPYSSAWKSVARTLQCGWVFGCAECCATQFVTLGVVVTVFFKNFLLYLNGVDVLNRPPIDRTSKLSTSLLTFRPRSMLELGVLHS